MWWAMHATKMQKGDSGCIISHKDASGCFALTNPVCHARMRPFKDSNPFILAGITMQQGCSAASITLSSVFLKQNG